MKINPNIEPDHRTRFIQIAGTGSEELVLLATLMPPIDDPDDNWSLVINLSYGDELKGKISYEVHKWLTAMSRSPGGQLYAVSIDGGLHCTKGTKWTVRDLERPSGFMSVWAVDDDDVFVGGYKGERLRIRGDKVTLTPDKQERWINGIHGSAADDVYAVGKKGVIFHFDGKKWTELESPTNHHLEAVLCRSKDEIYVAGWDGIIYRSDGEEWEKLRCPKITFSSLAWYRDTLYAAAAEDGVWRLTPKGMQQVTDLLITRLQPIGGHLYGVAETLVAQFDGKTWIERHLNI